MIFLYSINSGANVFTFMPNQMPPPSVAPALTPYSPSSTTINTSPSFSGTPLQISPGANRSSIPLKKRTLTNENTTTGLVRQMSADATSTVAVSNEPVISLNDWLKNRVLAVRRPRFHCASAAASAAIATSSASQQSRSHQTSMSHDTADDESDETISVGGGTDDESFTPIGPVIRPLFLDYLPALIENTNGSLVTVTFMHTANTAAATAATASTTTSDDAIPATSSSSSIVLSQSLPSNLSLLPSFQRYSFFQFGRFFFHVRFCLCLSCFNI